MDYRSPQYPFVSPACWRHSIVNIIFEKQLLALKLKDKQESTMICTSSDSDVQEVIAAILVKYQKL